MAHIRKRFLKAQIEKALKFSPLVGVLGQRQTGKTTLTEGLIENYVTFDDDEVRLVAQNAPKAFIEGFSDPQTIDECQKVPEVFNALKLRVQKNKRPGQFLLTGSVRFTSRKLIRESLTGRIFNLELLPLTLAEALNVELNDFTKLVSLSSAEFQRKVNERLSQIKEKDLQRLQESGGLPGICFLRESSHIRNRFRAHIETLLQRDIHLVSETNLSYDKLLLVLQFLAKKQSEPFSLAEASRTVRISVNTLKKVLVAFEGMFLLRRLKGFGYLKKEAWFLEDIGMANYLSPQTKAQKDWATMTTQLFAQAHYRYPHLLEAGYYASKGGAIVPLVIKVEGKVFGFIPVETEALDASQIASARAFRRTNKNAQVFILSKGLKALRIEEGILQIPFRSVL